MGVQDRRRAGLDGKSKDYWGNGVVVACLRKIRWANVARKWCGWDSFKKMGVLPKLI